MTYLLSILNKILRLTGKAVLSAVLVAVVFSPLAEPFFVVPEAQAQANAASTAAARALSECNASGGKNCNEVAAAAARQAIGAGDTPSCSVSAAGTWDVCLSNVVYVFTVGLGSGLAFVGSYFFDMTVRLSLDSASYALDFLSSGWTAARDLANMAFILILVYIAFMVMFEAETTGTIQMLAWVIFIALIINFSFFLTRVVVDTGNILAVQFYNAIDAPSLSYTTNTTGTGGNANCAAQNTYSGTGVTAVAGWLGASADTKDLTCNIMNAIKFQTLLNSDSFKTFYQSNTGVSGWGTNLIILSFIYIAAGAMYFIIAASFLAAGVKFLVRIIILWFAIIASPFALVARAIPSPKVRHYYDMWQSLLISHAFYPAVFMFVFFFINQIMRTIGNNNSLIDSLFKSPGTAAAATTGQAFIIMSVNIANVGIRLGLVVALLYIGMRAADSVGVFGAQAAQKFTNWVSRGGTGAVFGAAGLAGRYTAGWAGQRVAQNANLREAYSKGGPGGVVSGLLLRTGAGLSKKSFDLRGASSVRTGLGAIGIATNESGGTGGYAAAYADRVKRKSELGEFFKQNKSANERELQKILKGLPDEDKQNLAQAAKAVKDAQEDVDNFGSGDGRGNTLQQTTKNLKGLMKPYKDEADKKTGKDFKDNYAKTLTTPGFHNGWGALSSGIPGFISRADHEAASKMRDSKKEGARVAELVGVIPEDPKDHPGHHWDHDTKRWEPDAPPPPTPTPPIPPAQPQQNQNINPAVAALAAVGAAGLAGGGNQGGQQGGGPAGGTAAGGGPTPPRPSPIPGASSASQRMVSGMSQPQANAAASSRMIQGMQPPPPPKPQSAVIAGMSAAGQATPNARLVSGMSAAGRTGGAPLQQTPTPLAVPVNPPTNAIGGASNPRATARTTTPPSSGTLPTVAPLTPPPSPTIPLAVPVNPPTNATGGASNPRAAARGTTATAPSSGTSSTTTPSTPPSPPSPDYSALGASARNIDRTNQVREAIVEPSTPPDAPPAPQAAPGTNFTMPEQHTDDSDDVIDAHLQPDGSYGVAPAPAQIPARETLSGGGMPVPVANFGGKGWTPPKPDEGLSRESKRQIREMIKKEAEKQEDETDDKIKEVKDEVTNMAHARVPAEEHQARAEWVAKETDRIEKAVIRDTKISPTTPPPAPPPPPRSPLPDDKKKSGNTGEKEH